MIDTSKNKTLETLVLSKATKKDIPTILQLIRLLAKHHESFKDLVATEDLLEESLFCEKPCAEVVIARINNIAIGYMIFSFHFSTLLGKPTLYLVDLFIVPEKRQQGIGKHMLRHLAQIAEEKKCGRLEWSVLSSNKIAINFYDHMGADMLDEWKLYRIAGKQLKNLALDGTANSKTPYKF